MMLINIFFCRFQYFLDAICIRATLFNNYIIVSCCYFHTCSYFFISRNKKYLKIYSKIYLELQFFAIFFALSFSFFSCISLLCVFTLFIGWVPMEYFFKIPKAIYSLISKKNSLFGKKGSPHFL